MIKKRKKGFTLIELIAVLVILAILVLIVTPLVMNIIRKVKDSANKRSVDAYGRSVELAIATHLLDAGTFPTDLKSLTVEYTGKEVVCNVMQMKENGGIYLSECTVGTKAVKDSSTEDGWYHYGTRDLTNEEYVNMYGLALKNASVAYFESNGSPVEDYTTLTIEYTGKPVACDVTVNYDGTIYKTKCKVNNVDVTSETEEDGYCHCCADKSTAVKTLLSNVNGVTVTNYIDGNTKEMYTFEHPATTQTVALTDYRYIGANPNNYVTFNNELWRIIGVFTVEDGNGNTEQRIKIIKQDKLTVNNIEYAEDVEYSSNNHTNEWVNSLMSILLNIDYYNSLPVGETSKIVRTKYYIGGCNLDSTGDVFYSCERGTAAYAGRNSNWVGNFALMYVSDYVYTYAYGVNELCFNSAKDCNVENVSWIHKDLDVIELWTITPKTDAAVGLIKLNGYDPRIKTYSSGSGS